MNVPYRIEKSKVHPETSSDMISETCGENLGDANLYRKYRLAPVGTIVVRDEKEEKSEVRCLGEIGTCSQKARFCAHEKCSWWDPESK